MVVIRGGSTVGQTESDAPHESHSFRVNLLAIISLPSVKIVICPQSPRVVQCNEGENHVEPVVDEGIIWGFLIVLLQQPMDVTTWNWIIHASIRGSIVATIICVIIIDAIPMLPGYWAIFHLAGDGKFWFCLIGIVVASLILRFVIKTLVQHYRPSDIQIAGEAEKFGDLMESRNEEIEMNQPQR